MFEQILKKIDNIFHKDAVHDSKFDCVEQTSWLLFLKSLESLNKDKQTANHIQTISATTKERSAFLEEIKASSQELVGMAQRLQQTIDKLQL